MEESTAGIGCSLLGRAFYEPRSAPFSGNSHSSTALEYNEQLSLAVRCKLTDSGLCIYSVKDENRVCSQSRTALRDSHNTALLRYGKKGKTISPSSKSAVTQSELSESKYREEEQVWLSWSNMLLSTGIEPAGMNAGLPLALVYRPSQSRVPGDSFVLAGLKRSQYREKIPKLEFSKSPERFVGLCLLLEAVTSTSPANSSLSRAIKHEIVHDSHKIKECDIESDSSNQPAYTLAFASRYPMRQTKLGALSPTFSSFTYFLHSITVISIFLLFFMKSFSGDRTSS